MAKSKALKFKRTVQAPPREVYQALTNATALREWFSDTALVEPHKGGRVYFSWNQGYYATGEITKLNPDRKLAYTWQGRGEPQPTEVKISLAEKKGGTAISVEHQGVGTGKKWSAAAEAITRGWERGLENLQSVLETGHDQRFTLRPMMGITGSEPLTPEIAAQLGTPVTEGIRLDGTVESMGAHAAGLRKDDVLVSLGGQQVRDFASLVTALQAHRAGDKVPVVFYRGGEKQTVTLELSRRPLPEVPGTAVELAEALRKSYDSADAELAQVIAGVTDAEASFHPGPGEWNAKEVLAHLIIRERDTAAYVSELVAGDERLYNGSVGNSTLLTHATAAAYGTLPALFDELKRNEAETLSMLAALPDDFVSRRRSYWRMGLGILGGGDHTRDHLRQIQATVAATRTGA